MRSPRTGRRKAMTCCGYTSPARRAWAMISDTGSTTRAWQCRPVTTTRCPPGFTNPATQPTSNRGTCVRWD
ncbi:MULTISPECIES: hypothetical protein [Nonomuraea]|uniref:Uncharacterized protein n=1 Tax=Nonomuraea mangrovi TaxID=2316207 RepID=A0ABW4T8D1_9ACTN